uniref:Uncharacterized protein n=1 Tax=Candidatus Kentrum sp. LFY TaxID=2126342 RepID=A0A450UD28_9GAMM|nr:MAG: hypothetical protein BECKLFY1418A_GA0070994_101115 [Candidatus Kentron sp. LFY]
MLKAALEEAEKKEKLGVVEYAGNSQDITMSIFGSILDIPKNDQKINPLFCESLRIKSQPGMAGASAPARAIHPQDKSP